MFDLAGYIGLGADINKRSRDDDVETTEGVVSEKLPELKLEMDDDEIVKLADKWERSWNDSPKKQEWIENAEENEKYWLGKHFDRPQADKSRPDVDNLVFEALETYLPQTTRRNPEPLVEIHSKSKGEETNPAHDRYVEKVKARLVDLADENKVRLKLKKSARHWAVYLLGVAKFGWDLDRDTPVVRITRPKRIILDPDATIDEDGYTGDRIGEYRKLKASTILALMRGSDDASEKARKYLKEKVKDDLATEVNFVEWWTPKFMFWKLDSRVLLKKKNPHWNYDREEDDVEVDDVGVETSVKVPVNGINHFPVPRMPYSFLSVFNLGDQPMDKTSLIGQNLANQDRINKRNRQIDRNVDQQNSGMVVSLARSGLTQSQAKNVSTALRKGGVVTIPDGSPREAIDTYSPGNLPSDVFTQLLDTRQRMRDIFGTSGSTPAGIKDEKTVRGKIQIRGLDTDRIGGGVSEYLEQFADEIYNWFVQLLYVYDTEFQFLPGAEPPKLNISVKEGSLLPKDSISIANQALELAALNRISNVDLYKRLEYPNPEELAANIWLETNAPHLLYRENPLVQQALLEQQQAAQQQMQIESQEAAAKEAGKQGAQVVGNVAEEAGEELVGSMLNEVPIAPSV